MTTGSNLEEESIKKASTIVFSPAIDTPVKIGKRLEEKSLNEADERLTEAEEKLTVAKFEAEEKLTDAINKAEEKLTDAINKAEEKLTEAKTEAESRLAEEISKLTETNTKKSAAQIYSILIL